MCTSRYLHGAPDIPQLTSLGAQYYGALGIENRTKLDTGGPRITFLVNIWIHHHPSGVLPLDDSIASRLAALESASLDTSLCVMALAHPVEETVVISSMDVKDESVAGEWERFPFLSDDSVWGKDDEETALYLHAFIPSAGKLNSAISAPADSFLLRYKHDRSCARLEYEGNLEDEEFMTMCTVAPS